MAGRGAQRATALGLKSLVETGAWGAMGPSMATLGKNCAGCHKRFRLTEAERRLRAKAEAAAAATAPAAAVSPATTDSGTTP